MYCPTLDPSFSLGVQVSLPQQCVHPSPLEQLLLPFPTVLLPSPTGLPATPIPDISPPTVTMASLTVASKPPSYIMKHTLHDNPTGNIPTQTVLVGLGKRSNCLFIIQ